MKRRSLLAYALCAVAAGSILAGCSEKGTEEGILKIGCSPVPHADILKAAEPILAKDGVKIKVLNSLITFNPTWLWLIMNWMRTSSNTSLT